MQITYGDLSDHRTIRLLETHLETMFARSPAESVYALDLSGLRRADISFYAMWDADELLGVGALKALSATEGEVKSMHTAQAVRGRGVASALLVHIINEARSRGYRRLSLETGSTEAFANVRALYDRHGFVPCNAFGDYNNDPHSSYMTLAL